MGMVFLIIKHTMGLRAEPAEEIAGLDVSEHGLLTAYAGFTMLPETFTGDDEPMPTVVTGETPVPKAVSVKRFLLRRR
jgi:Amt family ammonium transporter